MQGDGDCEPSEKRSNAEACAGVMGILNQVQKVQMQRRGKGARKGVRRGMSLIGLHH